MCGLGLWGVVGDREGGWLDGNVVVRLGCWDAGMGGVDVMEGGGIDGCSCMMRCGVHYYTVRYKTSIEIGRLAMLDCIHSSFILGRQGFGVVKG